jgi:Kef-type K+ transport system membrane component KefB
LHGFKLYWQSYNKVKQYRNLLFYVSVTGGFGALMYYFIRKGHVLEAGKNIQRITAENSSMWQQFIDSNHHNLTNPMAILLLQIITIIIVARVVGFLFKLIKQPMVIGEIAAGIILGPSLVGLYFPEFSNFLFPAQSLGNLHFLSQIGLILFMFIVGMELDLNVIKNRASDAVIISHASIVIPFALGVGLAYFLYDKLAPSNISFLAFALFIGIAMSITAFPVLARIVQERGMTRTKIGSLVITCAAADDITAWSIFAAVIAIVKAGSLVNTVFVIAMAIVYIFIMLKVVKPFMKKMGEIYSNKENLSKPIVAVFFVTLFISAFTSEVIGIHALFGAFMAGVIMPNNIQFRNVFIEKMEDVALVIFLPLFFVYTGLRTQIGLINGPELWRDFGLIISIAVAGKFVGSALAAKFVGQHWKDSLTIGALMNTRGLMELVVLNVAYDLGVLTPEIFAMLVLMALVTTFMTGPALALINYIFPSEEKSILPIEKKDAEKYKILLSFGNPFRGKTMLRLAFGFIRKSVRNSNVTVLHLTPLNNLIHDNLSEHEQESFKPVKSEAAKLNLPIITLFKPSQTINKDILEVAHHGNFNLLIIGIGQSVFEGSFLGKLLGFTTRFIYPEKLLDTLSGKEKLFENSIFDDRTNQIIRSCKIPLGIFIDNELGQMDDILIPVFHSGDLFLIQFAQMLIENNDSKIRFLNISRNNHHNGEIGQALSDLQQNYPEKVTSIAVKKDDFEFTSQLDLMIVSIRGWKELVEIKSKLISQTFSKLIIKP